MHASGDEDIGWQPCDAVAISVDCGDVAAHWLPGDGGSAPDTAPRGDCPPSKHAHERLCLAVPRALAHREACLA